MRDKSHADFIQRWIKYMKEHPQEWKKQHTEFIDSQIIGAWDFYERLKRIPGGQEKIDAIRKMRATKAQ